MNGNFPPPFYSPILRIALYEWWIEWWGEGNPSQVSQLLLDSIWSETCDGFLMILPIEDHDCCSSAHNHSSCRSIPCHFIPFHYSSIWLIMSRPDGSSSCCFLNEVVHGMREAAVTNHCHHTSYTYSVSQRDRMYGGNGWWSRILEGYVRRFLNATSTGSTRAVATVASWNTIRVDIRVRFEGPNEWSNRIQETSKTNEIPNRCNDRGWD